MKSCEIEERFGPLVKNKITFFAEDDLSALYLMDSESA
jgi:hypothetical protein